MLSISAQTEPAFSNGVLQLQTHGVFEAEDFGSASFEKILAGIRERDDAYKTNNDFKTRNDEARSNDVDDNREVILKDDSENENLKTAVQFAGNGAEIDESFGELADVKTNADFLFSSVNEREPKENLHELSFAKDFETDKIPDEHLYVLHGAESQLTFFGEEKIRDDFSLNEDGLSQAIAKTDGLFDSGKNEQNAKNDALTNNTLTFSEEKSASLSQAASAQKTDENVHAEVSSRNDSLKEQAFREQSVAMNKDRGERNPVNENQNEKFVSHSLESSVASELKKCDDNVSRSDLNRVDEARSRRRDRLTVEVHNQRTQAIEQNTSARIAPDAPVREITLDLRLPYQGQTTPQSSAQTRWEASAALENMLARELHQNFNGDIVRHASMILRDGGEGTIKLALKPENLGNVKIHLEMSENKITGSIIVESEEALNAFRREISSLEQAFRESGFSDANLDLSFGMESGNNAGSESETLFNMHGMIASRYDDYSLIQGMEQESVTDVFIGKKPSTINLLA